MPRKLVHFRESTQPDRPRQLIRRPTVRIGPELAVGHQELRIIRRQHHIRRSERRARLAQCSPHGRQIADVARAMPDPRCQAQLVKQRRLSVRRKRQSRDFCPKEEQPLGQPLLDLVDLAVSEPAEGSTNRNVSLALMLSLGLFHRRFLMLFGGIPCAKCCFYA